MPSTEKTVEFGGGQIVSYTNKSSLKHPILSSQQVVLTSLQVFRDVPSMP